jgi:hypothetical protein
MSSRINARLDDDLAAQLEELRRLTGKTLTELVEAALRAYCAQLGQAPKAPYEVFRKSGFIGTGRGPRHLARDYKRELTKSLGRKT